MKALALAAALALSACAAPASVGTGSASPSGDNAVAASLVSGYILAANAAAAFEAAHPADASAVRACDDVAWAAIEPISQALAAGQSPTAAEMNAGNAAVAALTPCLTAAGVSNP